MINKRVGHVILKRSKINNCIRHDKFFLSQILFCSYLKNSRLVNLSYTAEHLKRYASFIFRQLLIKWYGFSYIYDGNFNEKTVKRIKVGHTRVAKDKFNIHLMQLLFSGKDSTIALTVLKLQTDKNKLVIFSLITRSHTVNSLL